MNAALVALALLAGDPGVLEGGWEVRASATSESRAGEAPILADDNPSPFVAEIVTPLVGLDVLGPGLSAELAYAPRLYWEDPNVVGSSGLLVLHTATLTFKDEVTRRLEIVGSASGSIGQPDYTSLPALLGSAQASLPRIVDIASLTALVRTTAAVSRRWSLELDGKAFYWKWLDVDQSMPLPGTVTGLSLGEEGAVALFRLNPRHALGFGVSVTEASYSLGDGVLTVNPTVDWKVFLAPHDELRLAVGLTYAQLLGTTPVGMMPFLGASGHEVAPTAWFQLASYLLRDEDKLVRLEASGGVDFYIDPIIGTAVPRGSLGAGLTANWARDWSGGLRVDFATALRTTPFPTVSGALPPDETAFSVTPWVRRRVSEHFFAELGMRWADRGAAFVDPDFHFHQRQIWGYLQLTGTTRPISRLAQ